MSLYEGVQVRAEVQLVAVTCYKCGVLFGLGAHYRQKRQEDCASFYCPNGHGQVYAESEADRLRKEVERQKKFKEMAEQRATSWRDQAETAERRRIAQKGVTTKLKKRIAAGVCPCCQRSFQNLGRHMAGQHPDFASDGAS